MMGCFRNETIVSHIVEDPSLTVDMAKS